MCLFAPTVVAEGVATLVVVGLFIGDNETVRVFRTVVVGPPGVAAAAAVACDECSPALNELTDDEFERGAVPDPPTAVPDVEWYLGLGCLAPYTDRAFLTDSDVMLVDDDRLPPPFPSGLIRLT